MILAAGCAEDDGLPSGPTSEPELASAAAGALAFEHVTVGYGFACGVAAADSRAYCWGENQNGALGDGTRINRSRPTAVAGRLRFRHLSAGTLHACGVTDDFKVYCWGYGGDGQLGNGSTNPARLTPAAVAGGYQFRQVKAGDGHTCAITRSNVAYCWGDNADGALGDGTTTRRLTPVKVKGGHLWSQLAGGFRFNCGVTQENLAYCWGINTLPDGTSPPRLTPTAIPGGLRFQVIEAGAGHVCAITTVDRLYCWGYNTDGEVGTGATTYYYPAPVAVAGTRRYSQLGAGYTHSCAVTFAAKAFCWGFNGSGQLGDGTGTTRSVPTAVIGGVPLTKVSAGVMHSCGVTAAGKAYCWGDNWSGELGTGTTGPEIRSPVAVAPPL